MEEKILEETAEDRSADEVILALGKMLAAHDARPAVLNLRRFQEMKQCYELIENLLLTPGTDISYRLHEPLKSMGSISLEANNFIFKEPEYLKMASLIASDMEVYPLANGKLRMTFGFSGLTTPIE